jgi:hypothetical protein
LCEELRQNENLQTRQSVEIATCKSLIKEESDRSQKK